LKNSEKEVPLKKNVVRAEIIISGMWIEKREGEDRIGKDRGREIFF
jgi:hypothetical protein